MNLKIIPPRSYLQKIIKAHVQLVFRKEYVDIDYVGIDH